MTEAFDRLLSQIEGTAPPELAPEAPPGGGVETPFQRLQRQIQDSQRTPTGAPAQTPIERLRAGIGLAPPVQPAAPSAPEGPSTADRFFGSVGSAVATTAAELPARGLGGLEVTAAQRILQETDQVDQGADPAILYAGAVPPNILQEYSSATTDRRREIKTELAKSANPQNSSLLKFAEGIDRRTSQVPRLEGAPGLVIEGLASIVPFMVVGAATGGLGAAGLGSMVNAGAQFEEALESGADLETAGEVLRRSSIFGGTEAIPIMGFLNRADRGGSIRRTLLNGIRGGTEEAIQEATLEILNNLTAQGFYDPERGVFTEVPESAGVGFTVGSIVSTAVTIMGGKHAQRFADAPASQEAMEAAARAGRSNAEEAAAAQLQIEGPPTPGALPPPAGVPQGSIIVDPTGPGQVTVPPPVLPQLPGPPGAPPLALPPPPQIPQGSIIVPPEAGQAPGLAPLASGAEGQLPLPLSLSEQRPPLELSPLAPVTAPPSSLDPQQRQLELFDPKELTGAEQGELLPLTEGARLYSITPEGVPPQISFDTGAGPIALTRLQSLDVAETSLTAAGGTVRGQDIRESTAAAIPKEAQSVDLVELPANPKVMFVKELDNAQRAEARTLIREAAAMMEESRGERGIAATVIEPTQAFDNYITALAMGARVAPQEGQSVLVVEEAAPSRRVLDIESPRLMEQAHKPFDTAITRGMGAVGLGRVGPETARNTPVFAPKTEAIAKQHLRVDAPRFQTVVGNAWLRGVNSGTTLAEVRKAVRTLGLRTSEGKRLSARVEQDIAAQAHTALSNPTDPQSLRNELQRIYDEEIAARNLRSELPVGASFVWADGIVDTIPKGFIRIPTVPAFQQDVDRLRENTTDGGHVKVSGVPDVRDVRRGQVRVGSAPFRLSVEQQARWTTAQKLVRKLVKTFAPDVKLTLALSNANSHEIGTVDGTLTDLRRTVYRKDAGEFGGQFGGYTDGVAVIAINPDLLSKAEGNLARTILHEFGHLLVWRHFRNSSAGMQAKVLRAYDRWRLAREGRRGAEAVRGLSPNFAHHVLTLIDKRGETPRTMVGAAPGKDLNYFYKFDEFMAEQTVLWFHSNAEPLSLVQKFFSDFAKMMKRAAAVIEKTFKLPVGALDFRAEPAVEEFLNSIRERINIPGSLPLTHNAFGEVQANSMEANGKALRGKVPDDMPGAADGAASVLVNEVLHNSPTSSVPKAQRRAEMAQWNRFMGLMLNIQQVVKLNPHIRGLQEYMGWVRQAMNLKYELIVRAEDTLKLWRNVGSPAQLKGLRKLLFEMDQFGIKEERWPTTEEEIAIIRKHKLNDSSVATYRQIKADFLNILNKYEEALQNAALRIENEEAMTTRLQEVKADFARLRGRPYFPHMRFGRFTTSVKDRATKQVLYMEAFETKIGRARARKAINRRYAGQNVNINDDTLPDGVVPLMAMPSTLLKQMRETPELKFSDEQVAWMDRLIFELNPAQGLRKNFLDRENVPGFSLDAERAYASYMEHAANHLSRITYAERLQGSILAVKEETDFIKDEESNRRDLDARRGIERMMREHLDSIMTPSTDLPFWRSLGFHWHLGAAPVAAAVNLTQVPLVTTPFLAARFGATPKTIRSISAVGNARATAAISKAYKDVAAESTKLKDRDPKLAKDLERAVREQVIDESQAAELAELSNGVLLQRVLAGTPLQKATRWASYISSFMFRHGELLNRRVTFRAARELALKHPEQEYLIELERVNRQEFRSLVEEGRSENEARAYLAAADTVRNTQLEYAREARPRAFRGPIKSVLFTFFMYPQQMLFFMRYTPGGAQLILQQLAIAGLMGLPFAVDLSELIKGLAALMGEEFDPEIELRKLLVELDANPDLILHGLSEESFGMKHVAEMSGFTGFPDIDMSRNLGFGELLPISPGIFTSGDFERSVTEGVTGGAGAAFSIPLTIMETLQRMDEPDVIKRAFGGEATAHGMTAPMLPRALRNVSKAYQIAKTNEVETRGGTTLVEFDLTDPTQQMEVIMQGLGFTLGRVSNQWNARRARQEPVIYWQARKAKLLKYLDTAVRKENPELQKEAMRRIAVHNNEAPEPSLMISRDTIRQSLRGRIGRRAREEAGLPPTNVGVGLAIERQGLFEDQRRIVSDEEVK